MADMDEGYDDPDFRPSGQCYIGRKYGRPTALAYRYEGSAGAFHNAETESSLTREGYDIEILSEAEAEASIKASKMLSIYENSYFDL